MLNNNVVCPHCGYQLEKTDHYCYYHWDGGACSDVRHEAPEVMVPSIVQFCPRCAKYFIQDEQFSLLKDIRRVNFIDPVEYPALKDGFKSYDTFKWNDIQQFNQRMRFLWAYNDYFYHNNDGTREPTNEDIGNFLLNVERLKRFLHPTQYAEYLRQAGSFGLCISKLRMSMFQMEDDEKLFAEHVIKLAEQGINAPFCVNDIIKSEESKTKQDDCDVNVSDDEESNDSSDNLPF